MGWREVRVVEQCFYCMGLEVLLNGMRNAWEVGKWGKGEVREGESRDRKIRLATQVSESWLIT